jgi:hypothetical protein
MAETKDPHGDEHIEELLSQLQGIFGKLSRSEEEESQTKIDPPKPPEEAVSPETPVPEETLNPGPPTVPDSPFVSVAIPDSPPPPETVLPANVPELPTEIEASAPIETPAAPLPMAELPKEADKSVVFSVIFYPLNKENEAKLLHEKVETMTPRFTKVAFQIKVSALIPIDLKGDPQETVLPHVKEGIRAIFIIADRPLEESRRKIVTGALESRGIYVHEVPSTSVEKKAFYTDLLLGMVFFYDSLKSGQD